MLTAMKERDQDKALSGATAYLALAGDVIGGHFLTKAATAARSGDLSARARNLALAGFFAETALASVPGRVPGITEGGATFLENSEALFGV
jgi:hypothetical protein